MRRFVEPEMKVMKVNMKENIAASSTQDVNGYNVSLDSEGKMIHTDIAINFGQIKKNYAMLSANDCVK